MLEGFASAWSEGDAERKYWKITFPNVEAYDHFMEVLALEKPELYARSRGDTERHNSIFKVNIRSLSENDKNWIRTSASKNKYKLSEVTIGSGSTDDDSSASGGVDPFI